MAGHLQQIQNGGGIPIMSGVPAGVQPTIVYQQQPQGPFVVASGGGGAGHHHIGGPGEYVPRKPYMRNPQEEQCKIFVGGVGKNTTEESLRGYFGKFGEIADSVIMKDKHTHEPRGFAFVTFKMPESVQAVIDQCNAGGHTLDGKLYLQVRKYFPKAEYDAEKAQVMQASGNPQMGFEYKGPMKVQPELKIFVGGIGIGTTEDDVRKYFSNYGKVIQVDMPYHHVYKCPKGFAFVGFESYDTVLLICKDRYHQINGKTVEVKGADEQQAHLNKKRAEGKPVNILTTMGRGQGRFSSPVQPGSIATVSGYGAYANLGGVGASPQVILPQGTGMTQYVQVPAAATGGGYVFDPATNTYYQLPGGLLTNAGGLGQLGQLGQLGGLGQLGQLSQLGQLGQLGGLTGGLALSTGGSQGIGGVVASVSANNGAAAQQYAGMTLVGGLGGQQVLTSPQIQRAGVMTTADMLPGQGGGIAYQNETSTFGPTRHVLGVSASGQQPIAGSADPHVVYSTATSISAGDAAISSNRGFHPYGR